MNIIGYEGYYKIYEDGSIFSMKSNRYIKPYMIKSGYMIVDLYKDGNRSQKYVHILVAQHFIPNPDNLPQVNHKDGNKSNYNHSNLEWCTQSYNIKHSFNTGLRKPTPYNPANKSNKTHKSINVCRRGYVRKYKKPSS